MSIDEFMTAGKRAQADVVRALQESEARVDTQTASKILGISARQLEEMRAQAKGPPYLRLGKKKIKYELSALIVYLDQQRVEHPAD